MNYEKTVTHNPLSWRTVWNKLAFTTVPWSKKQWGNLPQICDVFPVRPNKVNRYWKIQDSSWREDTFSYFRKMKRSHLNVWQLNGETSTTLFTERLPTKTLTEERRWGSKAGRFHSRTSNVEIKSDPACLFWRLLLAWSSHWCSSKRQTCQINHSCTLLSPSLSPLFCFHSHTHTHTDVFPSLWKTSRD